MISGGAGIEQMAGRPTPRERPSTPELEAERAQSLPHWYGNLQLDFLNRQHTIS